MPNQPNAVNISVGTPVADGRTFIWSRIRQTFFKRCLITQLERGCGLYSYKADIGVNYGLTRDANGYWYVDKHLTGGSAVVQVIGLPSGFLRQRSCHIRLPDRSGPGTLTTKEIFNATGKSKISAAYADGAEKNLL